MLLYSAVSIAGLLVMVSSELVVLLIVCVGINTGSAQQGELTTELVYTSGTSFKIAPQVLMPRRNIS